MRVITQQYFERSLDYILEDEYWQERLIAVLDHFEKWHMLEGRVEEVASWLLWERQSMMGSQVGHPDTVQAIKNNVILQLMINKFFDGEEGDLVHVDFGHLGIYGEGKLGHASRNQFPLHRCIISRVCCIITGMSNFLFYSQHMAMTGRLPPAFIVTASVA
jgi:hypothetical protein